MDNAYAILVGWF